MVSPVSWHRRSRTWRDGFGFTANVFFRISSTLPLITARAARFPGVFLPGEVRSSFFSPSDAGEPELAVADSVVEEDRDDTPESVLVELAGLGEVGEMAQPWKKKKAQHRNTYNTQFFYASSDFVLNLSPTFFLYKTKKFSCN